LTVQCTNGCSHDSGNRIVVPRVIDGPNNCLLRIMPVSHQDVDNRRHCFQEIGAGMPVVAGIQDRHLLLVSFPDIIADEPMN